MDKNLKTTYDLGIYHAKNGNWVNYSEEKKGILVCKNGEWVEGSADLNNPSVSVHICKEKKYIQVYPKFQITYKTTVKSSGLKTTHTQSTNWDAGSGVKSSAIGGRWKTDAIYTGWLGLLSKDFEGGKANILEITDVKATYERRGVGNWEKKYKIPLVLSPLKSATGSGANAHSSKKSKTFFSDTTMTECTELSQLVKGTTTFNNADAKKILKEWMQKDYSILLGYKDDATMSYVGLYSLILDITYTCKVSKAIFSKEQISKYRNYNIIEGYLKNNVSLYNLKDNFEMFLYDDEIDLSIEEIIKNRLKLNRDFINPLNVQQII